MKAIEQHRYELLHVNVRIYTSRYWYKLLGKERSKEYLHIQRCSKITFIKKNVHEFVLLDCQMNKIRS